MKTKEQIEALRVALLKAVAEAEQHSQDDDGGTSNFDTPVINLKGWKKLEILEAFIPTGLYPNIEKNGIVNILRACLGQGFRRTAMAEAFRDSLRASSYTAYVEYRMD